eukprot:17341_1
MTCQPASTMKIIAVLFVPIYCIFSLNGVNAEFNAECNYLLDAEYTITTKQIISNSSMVIQQGSLKINFVILAIQSMECNRSSSSKCHIISLHHQNNEIVSLSLNTETNNFKVKSMNNAKYNEVYTVSEINILDNEKHFISLEFTKNNTKIFTFDDEIYYESRTIRDKNDDYRSLLFYSTKNMQYSLFVGDDEFITGNDTFIGDICIANQPDQRYEYTENAPYSVINRICDNDTEEQYEFFQWNLNLNASVYRLSDITDNETETYLYPIMDNTNNYNVYIIGTEFDDNINFNITDFDEIHTDIDVVMAFCIVDDDIFDLNKCIKRWYEYNENSTESEWVNYYDIIIVQCDDICITAMDYNFTESKYNMVEMHAKDMEGTYEWMYFSDTINGSVYYCNVCEYSDGLYLLPGHFNGSYYWFVSHLLEPGLNNNFLYIRAGCYLGDADELGPNYMFTVNSCDKEKWLMSNINGNNGMHNFGHSMNVAKGSCDAAALSGDYFCFNASFNNIYLPFNPQMAYWNNTVYIFSANPFGENTFWQSDSMNYNFSTVSFDYNLSGWFIYDSTQIENKIYTTETNSTYYYTDNIFRIKDLFTKNTISTTNIVTETRSFIFLRLCNNVSHVFAVGNYSIFIYNTDSNVWTISNEAMPLLGQSSCNIINNQMFIFGGLNGSKIRTDSIYRYDVLLDRLNIIDTVLPYPANQLKTLTVKHYVYIYHAWTDPEIGLSSTFGIQIFDTTTYELYGAPTQITYDGIKFRSGVGYYDGFDKIVVFAGNGIYYLRSDAILVDFDKMNNQFIIPGDAIFVYNLFVIEMCDILFVNSMTLNFIFTAEDKSINHRVSIINGSCGVICKYNVFDYDICTECKYGITPTLTIASSNFISIEPELQIYPSSQSFISINIAECPIGRGIDESSFVLDCIWCQINQFKVIKANKPCYSCTVNINTADKIWCNGKSDISIAHNVWIAIIRNENNKSLQFISPFSIEANDKIYGIQCSPNLCCQSSICSFLDSFDDTQIYDPYSGNLCAKNRDFNIPLCARCIDKKYELFGTAECGDCVENSNLMWLLPIYVASILFLILLWFNSKPINDSLYYDGHELNYSKLFIMDELTATNIMLMKIMVYYFQSLSQIISSKCETLWSIYTFFKRSYVLLYDLIVPLIIFIFFKMRDIYFSCF